MKFKQFVVRIIFCVEIIVVIGFNLFSPHGLSALSSAKSKNELLQEQLLVLKRDIADLEHQITAWNSDAFYVEQVAREQLQMVRAGEEIYYVTA